MMAELMVFLGVFSLLAIVPGPAFSRTTPVPAHARHAPDLPDWTAGPSSLPSPELRPIVIDPGHGGRDLGAVVGSRQEKDIALAIARKLRSRLQELGLSQVRLTRDSDDFIPLDGRVQETSSWDGALFISLHANKVFRRSLHGITVYFFGAGSGRSDRRHRHLRHHSKVPPLPAPPQEQVRASGRLAASLVSGLRREGFRVEPLARAQYYVLKNPRTPSLLVELGYLSNPAEAKLLDNPAYQDRLAETLAKSLVSHLAQQGRDLGPGRAALLHAKAPDVAR